MIRIVSSELLKFRSRRAVRWLFLLCALGVVVGAVITFFTTPAGSPASDVVMETGTIVPATVDERLYLTDYRAIFIGTSIPLMALAWLVGASSIGADWQKGTMTTTLTWESRRAVVFVGKAVALAIGIVAFYLAVQAWLALALAPTVWLRGTTLGADAEWLVSMFGALLRGAAATVIMALIGYALATLGRNTAAAVGVGFGYVVIVENLVRGLKPQWQSWLLSENLAVLVTGELNGLEDIVDSVGSAAVLVSVYTVALGAVALASFNARDVT